MLTTRLYAIGLILFQTTASKQITGVSLVANMPQTGFTGETTPRGPSGTSATTPGTAALVEASTFLSGVSTKEGNGVSGVSTKEGNGVYSDEASGKGPKLLKVPGGGQATPTYRASHSL